MPAYTVKLIVDDDGLDDASTITSSKIIAEDRTSAQAAALRKYNDMMMAISLRGPSFAVRLHDCEWEKDGSMSRPEMRLTINELWEKNGGTPPKM